MIIAPTQRPPLACSTGRESWCTAPACVAVGGGYASVVRFSDECPLRVVAVVVAYNREILLEAALDALAEQTRPVDAVVVVDNASTDGSLQVARGHESGPDVVSLERNTGGAGGFAAGLARALAIGADLVWMMDDDTMPRPTALAELLAARDRYDGEVALLASRAVWIDGRDHPMNTPRERPLVSPVERARAARCGAIAVRSASFVSILIDGTAVRATGLPEADYFLWNDDFEFTGRLLRDRIGLYVPASVVEHRTKVFGSTNADPGERFFLEVRNKLWLLCWSRAFGPLDRLLYGASTLRRWGVTLARSPRRGVVARAGLRGLAAGLTRRPRPTTVVLAGLGLDDELRAVTAPESQPAELPPFSLLLPTYSGDDPVHFDRALRSCTVDQTLRPSELVLVRDGPVAPRLSDVIDRWRRDCPVPLTVVELTENQGLARALEAGLAACTHDIVARADADDISLPSRFAIQVPRVAAGLDLIGSAIQEFVDEDTPEMVRLPPLAADEIARYARFHDPFNHPSVVYRASAVHRAGGYRDLDRMEDYWLFARMIADGAKVANVPDVLVLYRVGRGAYARRGGWRLLRSEWRLQRVLRASRFTTRAQSARNLAVRGTYRLVPQGLRRLAYRRMRSGVGARVS